MKRLIVILSVVLAILIAVALFLFLPRGEKPAEPTRASATTAPQQTTQATEAPTTTKPEAPTTEASTEPPTEPLPEMLVQEPAVVLAGKAVESWWIDGKHYIAAPAFADALGMTLEATQPSVRMRTAHDTLEVTAERITANGTSVDVQDGVCTLSEQTYILFQECVEALGYPTLYDEEYDVTYITPAARPFEIPQGVNVPVLMYHAVNDDTSWGSAELMVSPSTLEEQLQYLLDNGYDPIWFEDLAYLDEYDKPVILTFDDGYLDNYEYLFPLLKKYQVKATVFIIADHMGMSHKATPEQVREMAQSGVVSIQSHTFTHEYLSNLSRSAQEDQMRLSRLKLARTTGLVPYVLCYPTGMYNGDTLELGPQYYLFGIKMNGGLYNTSDDPFLVNRYYVSRYTGLDTFAAYVASAGT